MVVDNEYIYKKDANGVYWAASKKKMQSGVYLWYSENASKTDSDEAKKTREAIKKHKEALEKDAEKSKEIAQGFKDTFESLKSSVKKYLQGLCAIIQKGSDTSEGKNISNKKGECLDISVGETNGKEPGDLVFPVNSNLPASARIAVSESYDVMQGINRISKVYSMRRGDYYREYLEDNKKRIARYQNMNTAISKSLDASLSVHCLQSGVQSV